MILHNENDELMGTVLADAADFGIVLSRKAYKVLSDTLYTYKIRAIIRELSCNASDAHILAGHRKPFDIQLPSLLDCRFIIRDYGPGLSNEQINTVFTVYFKSSKEHTNDFTGALGLGSKSPFSYGSRSFTVISRHEGIRSVYSMAWQSGRPVCMTISQTETDEPSGLEIIVPVDEADIDEWYNEARNVFRAFSDVKPNVTSHHIDIDYFPEDREFKGPRGVYALMGNIMYPIPRELWSKRVFATLTPDMVFRFEIGDLDFAPSREQLSLDEHTIDAINKRFDEYEKSSIDAFQDHVDLCKSRRDLYDYVMQQPSAIADFITENMEWKGSPIKEVFKVLRSYHLLADIKVYERSGSTVQTCQICKKRLVMRRMYPMRGKVMANDVYGPSVKRVVVMINDMPGFTNIIPQAMIDNDIYYMAVLKKDTSDMAVLDILRNLFDETELTVINASDYKQHRAKRKKNETRPKSPNVILVDREKGSETELFLTASEVRALEGVAMYTYNGAGVTKDQRPMPYVSYDMAHKIGCTKYYEIRPAAYKYARESKLVPYEEMVNKRVAELLSEIDYSNMAYTTHHGVFSSVYPKLKFLANAGFMQMRILEPATVFMDLQSKFRGFADETLQKQFQQIDNHIEENTKLGVEFVNEFAEKHHLVFAFITSCYSIPIEDERILRDIMKLKEV